ncbi:uncharacterized protein LOC133815391 [Humulus lupulus]|uniref:uncharacterized protein LOC133815391 n=1 Tax=Humulus lupulus TaxID=3486 RepID=UPI002B402F40|nr:uncharacterized protein LOC133815391 [Humulus lupulus]
MDELVDQIIEDIESIKEEHRNFRKFLPKDCRRKSQDSYDEDKMSQKRVIKIPKASDAMAKAKLTIAKRPKTSGSQQVSEIDFSDIPLTQSSLGTCTTIKRKVDFLDPEVPDETVLRIPHTVSVYSNPTSIEGHVSGLLHPADRERLNDLGRVGAANYGVAEAYKILQAMIYIREDYPVWRRRIEFWPIIMLP